MHIDVAVADAVPSDRDLADRLRIRRMRADDAPLVRSLLETLSDEGRYLRFLSPMPVIPDRIVSGIVGVGDGHLGRLALLDGVCVGEGTVHRAEEDATHGELSITVAAGHRRMGIGTALCRALASDALSVGIHTFDLFVAPANLPSRAMVRSLGAKTRFSHGIIEGSLSASALLEADREQRRAS